LVDALKFSGLVGTASACETEVNAKTFEAGERTVRRLRTSFRSKLLKILQDSDSAGGEFVKGCRLGENESKQLASAEKRSSAEKTPRRELKSDADRSPASSSGSIDSSESGTCSLSESEKIANGKTNGTHSDERKGLGATTAKRTTQENADTSGGKVKQHDIARQVGSNVESSSESSDAGGRGRAGLGALAGRPSSKLKNIQVSAKSEKAHARKDNNAGEREGSSSASSSSSGGASSGDSSDSEKHILKSSSDSSSSSESCSSSQGSNSSNGSSSSDSTRSRRKEKNGSNIEAMLDTNGVSENTGRGAESREVSDSESNSDDSESNSNESDDREGSSSSDTYSSPSKSACSSDSDASQDSGKAGTPGSTLIPAVANAVAPHSSTGKRIRKDSRAADEASTSDLASKTSSGQRGVIAPRKGKSKRVSCLRAEGDNAEQSVKSKAHECVAVKETDTKSKAQAKTKSLISKDTRDLKLTKRGKDKDVPTGDTRDQAKNGESMLHTVSQVPNGTSVIQKASIPLNGFARSRSVSNLATAVHETSLKTSKKRRLSDTGILHSQNTPFKRVKEDSVKFQDDRLRDNTFFSKADTYGMKAHQDLSVTRGKGFRKVMTKKKRQAHHGGTLDANNVSSFKFSDSDSD
jgi:hypothetical protein